jgi:beta-galactosidase
MADDATLDWLVAYAAAGGHLILGPQTGYTDHEGRARAERQPARIASAARVWFDEFSNLSQDLPVTSAPGGGLALPPQAAGTRWLDGLQPSGAQELAHYQHPHFGRWPAVTSTAHERGQITYVGTIPNPAFARAIFEWLGPVNGRPAWKDLPPSATTTSGTGRAGRRIHFLHNWSWTATQAAAPCPLDDVLTGERFDTCDPVALRSWDVRILAEAQPPDEERG